MPSSSRLGRPCWSCISVFVAALERFRSLQSPKRPHLWLPEPSRALCTSVPMSLMGLSLCNPADITVIYPCNSPSPAPLFRAWRVPGPSNCSAPNYFGRDNHLRHVAVKGSPQDSQLIMSCQSRHRNDRRCRSQLLLKLLLRILYLWDRYIYLTTPFD